MSGRFGTPGSIDPLRLLALPPGDQRLGALMLLDMGLTEDAARRHLGLSMQAFSDVLHGEAPLARRGLETDMTGDYA